ncbi:MAG: DUF202 domain-containing protein [Microbacteriaceae bacterium]|nr:DUF202 domain-containing protein [Microbacteriaceae bacterium]
MTRRRERTPVDAGLQPERTELSWRRTLLALAVASVASARALSPLLGVGAFIVAGAGLGLTGALAVTTRHRFRRMHEWFGGQLRRGPADRVGTAEQVRPVALGGRLPLALAVFLSLGSAFALAQAVTHLPH